MEQPTLMLDDQTDPVTKQMLINVVKRKQILEQYKKKHHFAMYCTIFLTLGYFIYLYITVVKPYSYSFSSMFTAYVSNTVNLYLLIITMGTYGLMNVFRQKRDKSEKEFHALRCEIIDKSKELWKKEESWNNRHRVFEMMKKTYNINLYHENK